MANIFKDDEWHVDREHSDGQRRVKNKYGQTIAIIPNSAVAVRDTKSAVLLSAAVLLFDALNNVPMPERDETDAEFITRYSLWLYGKRQTVLRKAEEAETP